jgi:serine/threonine-protein kinase HipA
MTNKAEVLVHGRLAGQLEQLEVGRRFRFTYRKDYDGPAVSLTMPGSRETYEFEGFPPFFDGLLPEGQQLEGLLRQAKIDASDCFAQLLAVGADLVGAVTVLPVSDA